MSLERLERGVVDPMRRDDARGASEQRAGIRLALRPVDRSVAPARGAAYPRSPA
jgi:hypothetical protein